MKRTTIILFFAMFGSAQSAGQDLKTRILAATAAPPDVAVPPIDAEITASGLATRRLKPGNGTERPGNDDCVKASFTAWRPDGSLFTASGLHGEAPVQCLGTAIPGVAEALKLMVTGEKRRVWIPASLSVKKEEDKAHAKALGSQLPRDLDATYDLELADIIKAPPAPLDVKAPPPQALILPSGIAIQVLAPGDGKLHPPAGSRVTVHYSCWTADGRLYESTALVGHSAVIQVGTALPGLQEGLQHMVAGQKARLWIPAALAYGAAPRNKKLPAGNLTYEIELLAVN